MGGSSGYDGNQPFVVEKKEDRVSAPPPSKGKGMPLGSKINKKSDFAKILKEDKIIEKEEEIEDIVSGRAVPDTKEEKQGPVHVVIEEQLTILVENDGGLQNMIINGGLAVNVNDASLANVQVAVNQGDNKQFQFKTHPNIDKQSFQNGVIKAKDAGKPLPSAVMKWRLQTNDESLLPLSVSCWPSPSKDGQTYVTMEYEMLNVPNNELKNVVISVPVSGSSPPVVSKVEGHHDWDGRNRILTWRLPIIDASSKTGALEFAVPQADPKGFFPLTVTFSSSRTFCDISVESVTNGDAPVKHTENTALTVEEFKIV